MQNLTISHRATNTPPSATRKFVPLALAAKERGINVYYLHIGQPDLPTPPEILERVRSIDYPILKYAPSPGMPETIAAWETFYSDKNYPLQKHDILVTAGGAEALILAFFAVADPSDEILVFEPFYTSYATIAAMGNINLHPMHTRFEEQFHLPKASDIERAISTKTKAIVICNPNNPTGTLYTDAEVKMIADIARKHNLFIISDETYQEIVFDNKRVLPFFQFPDILDRLIVVDSVSKRFNACGARIGCIASKNQEIMQAVLRFAQGRLSVATIEQFAVIPLLENHKKYIESIRDVYQKRRGTVQNYLESHPFAQASYPEGAFYMMLKLPIEDSDDFAAYCLNQFYDKGETVMVAPGTGFYVSPGAGKEEVRIAYVLEEKKLVRGMELLEMAVRQYNRGHHRHSRVGGNL